MNGRRSIFLPINDKGAPFHFSRRSKTDPTALQPVEMNRLFRDMIGRTKLKGAITFKDFRSSFVVHLARPDEGALSIRNIMEVTGYRDYDSVKRIVDMDTRALTLKVNGIYNRL